MENKSIADLSSEIDSLQGEIKRRTDVWCSQAVKTLMEDIAEGNVELEFENPKRNTDYTDVTVRLVPRKDWEGDRYFMRGALYFYIKAEGTDAVTDADA